MSLKKDPQERVDTEADLGEVRHKVDIDSLTQYLTSKLPQDFEAPLQLKQFGFGQSNPSYQIKDAKGRKYVLRKQPQGKLVSKTAHRVDREFYMLKSLGVHTNVPVPRVLDLCQDKKIIGTDFYIMDFVEGRIFHDPGFPGLPPQQRRELWGAAIKALSSLHQVDPTKIDLPQTFLRNLSSHYPRQTVTLAKVEAAQADVVVTADDSPMPKGKPVGHIPNFETIVQWMKNNMPPERVSIVHGDYKIDNVIFHPTENRVVAILDWELCTIGHPLADLGNLFMPYFLPSGDQDELAKCPTLDEHFDLYQSLNGWDPRAFWTFAKVYAHFRLSVISHGIAARAAVGQASSARANEYASLFTSLSDFAMSEIKSTANSSKL